MAVKSKKAKIAISVLAALTALIIVFLGIFLGTDIIQSAWIKATCKDEPSSYPDNYDAVKAATTLTTVEYADGLYLDVIEPQNPAEDVVTVVYFHGGYYVGGGRHNQEPYCRLLATRGFRVFNVDYSLAPESTYPRQLLDANAALNYAAESYAGSKGFVVAGDSAGAHLAAQLSVLVNDAGLRKSVGARATIAPDRLLGCVANCGFFEASTVKKSRFFLVGSAMRLLTGVRNYEDYDKIHELDVVRYASVVPPIMLVCGDKDRFLDQNKQMAQAVTDAGGRVVTYFPKSGKKKLGHEFQSNYKLAESYTAMDKTVEFINSL